MLADGSRSRFRAVNDRPYGIMHNLISVTTRPLTYFFRYFVILSIWPGSKLSERVERVGGQKNAFIYFIIFFSLTLS